MIHLDTSAVIDAITGPRRSAPQLRMLLAGREPMALSSIVLFEWLRGPRIIEELELQEHLFPASTCALFGPLEARIAAELYRRVRRPRGREADLAIAACAIANGAVLWTLNPEDFVDIPQLELVNHKR